MFALNNFNYAIKYLASAFQNNNIYILKFCVYLLLLDIGSIISNIFMSTISAEDASMINLRNDNTEGSEEASQMKFNSASIETK